MRGSLRIKAVTISGWLTVLLLKHILPTPSSPLSHPNPLLFVLLRIALLGRGKSDRSSIARSFVCTGQKDKSNSRVASAGFADQHPPALNKHHQTEQRHPWSTKSCGVCYSHHIQRRQPFTCKVLQRKWQKLIRQWESNTALNRLDNSCSLAGCNGKEA